jgi:hypothetical protein
VNPEFTGYDVFGRCAPRLSLLLRRASSSIDTISTLANYLFSLAIRAALLN